MSEAAKKARSEYKKRYLRNMTPEQKQKKAEHLKAWKQRNPEKVRQYNIDYWERRAARDIKQLIVAFDKQGLSLREIGKKLNISHMTVNRVLQEYYRNVTL